MKTLLIATTALVAFATPASAQLLGGSGGLSGALGGGFGSPMGTVGSVTRGTLDGAAATSGSQTVDRRSGKVHAERAASGSITGTTDSVVTLPNRTLTNNASGTTSGSASAGGDAQLIGTDAVRSAGSGVLGTTRNSAGAVRDRAGQSAGMISNSASGAAQGSGQTSGSRSFSGALGQLALSGTSAAQGAGSFDVAPGMMIVDRSGKTIGEVQSVAADAKGRIKSVLVGVGNRAASIPAANFTGSGDVLISAMGKGELKRAAKDGDAQPAPAAEAKPTTESKDVR